MKYFKLIQILFLLIVSNIIPLFSQDNLLDEFDLDFSYHIIEKQDAKDVYIKWNTFDLHNSVYVNNSIVRRDHNSSGIFLTDVTFPLDVRIVQNRIGEVIHDKIFTLVSKDISIVDVSHQLFDKFTLWENSGQDIFTFFESDNTISNYELFSFYQAYLGITPTQMTNILNNSSFNNLTKIQFKTQYWQQVRGINLSSIELGLSGPNGPGDTIKPVECNCKMIRTNSSALNRPNGNPSGSTSPQCNQASPTWQDPITIYNFSNIVWPTLLRYYWRGGLLGASKFGNMDIGVLGCKKSGLKKQTLGSGDLGASTILFRMSCYSIGSQTIKYNNECNCEKEICINYQYSSHVRTGTATEWAPFCDKSAKIKVEDYAILTKTTSDGQASSLNSGIALISSACEVPQDTSFVTNLNGLFNAISGVLKNTTSASTIIGGVTTIGQFFANVIGSKGTCEEKDTSYTLMSGQQCFRFNSHNRDLQLTIISRANFEGEANGAAGAYGALNSSFYMAAVLQTLNPSIGCCQEKIGSYVLGTVMDFPINNTGPINNMSTGKISNLGDLQNSVGSYIGSFSPWGGNFQGSGCCDDVLIDCHSKCVHFVEGECKNLGGIQDNLIESRIRNNDYHWVIIQPVPALLGQEIQLNFSEVPMELNIYNSSGTLLNSLRTSETNIILQSSNYSPGVYITQTVFENKTIVSKFTIH